METPAKSNHYQANSYNGLQMRCAPGTHGAALDLLLSSRVPTSAKVLDVASGSGALLARMADAGFGNLTAIELDRPKFEFARCEPISIDLNQPFRHLLANDFNLITAIEIIEHLDSPRAFLRELHALLADGGMLLLSTPNLCNWRGRLKFLLTGDLRYFDRGQYEFNHHISPITHTQMVLMLEEVGFEIVQRQTAGRFPQSRWAAPMDWLGQLCGGCPVVDEVNLYLCRKTSCNTDHV